MFVEKGMEKSALFDKKFKSFQMTEDLQIRETSLMTFNKILDIFGSFGRFIVPVMKITLLSGRARRESVVVQ